MKRDNIMSENQVACAGTVSTDRPALLCLTGSAGLTEHPVIVVGETPKRYRIRATEPARIAGRNRYLHPGRTVLVPRQPVRFP